MMPEIMEDAAYCLTPHGLVNLPSYSTQDHQPQGGVIRRKLNPLTSFIGQENALSASPPANMMGVFSH